jgi:hypothetical protein
VEIFSHVIYGVASIDEELKGVSTSLPFALAICLAQAFLQGR